MISWALAAIVVSFAALYVVGVVGAGLISRAYPPGGEFVEVDGTRLHVVELAASQPRAGALPVLLIHGASGNVEEMRLALGARLSRRHRVILVDRPGLGWSARGDAVQADPARQARLIAGVLDRLGVERAVVVGHSLGGAVALALALAAPRRVAGLVLLAPVAYPWPGGISWYYKVATLPLLGKLFAATLELPIALLAVKPAIRAVFAPQAPPEHYFDRAAIPLVLRPQSFLANARDVAGLKAAVVAQSPHYPEIVAPTVIVVGDRDRTVSPDIHSQALARVLPHARLVVLAGVGHMPHYAAPDVVEAAVEEVAAAAPLPPS